MRLEQQPDAPAPILDSRGPDPHPAQRANLPGTIGVDLAVDGEEAVEWLSGDIDILSADHIAELGTLTLAEPRIDVLVLDMSGVTFLDSTGLGAMVRLLQHARASGKSFRLRGVPPPVSKLLELTQMDTVFGLPRGDAGRC